jgi:putative Mg2+ transporter-C (MgtC) family protein
MEHWTELALRIAAAVLAGGAIGVNRDMYGKPSGVRVHALVALGAAVVTMIGTEAGLGAHDPAAASRIIQGVIGGIGFLGAGVILRGGGSSERRIYHVTTAASIWVTAALGIACGAGAWAIAALAAVAAMVVLVVGLKLDKALYGRLGPEE